MEQFQLDAVFAQADADAAIWGRNKAARGYGWTKGWGKKHHFPLPWMELVFGLRKSPCVGTGCGSFRPLSEKGC